MLSTIWCYWKLLWFILFHVILIPWAFCYGFWLSIKVGWKFPNMSEGRRTRIAMKHLSIINTKIYSFLGF